MSLALLIVFAPVVYWILGAGILARRADNALEMALLLGGAVAGLGCELSYAMGVRPEYVIILICAISLLSLAFCPQRGVLANSLAKSALLYFVALVPIAISPFPILGNWGGDWLFLFKSGRELVEGLPMTAGTLQRPPLFGAAAAPLWILADGLIPFQLFAAVMSGGVLSACLYAIKKLRPQAPIGRVLVFLAISPFFLHNTAACWGKLMASGLLLAACVDALHAVDKRALWWSAVWFALSVAVHQSSIIYVPLLAMCVLAANRGQVMPSLWAVIPYAVCGVLLVASFEGWTVLKYGLQAKIDANPAYSQRDPNVSFAANTLLAILASIIAWAPVEGLLRWSRQPDALSKARIVAESFWLITSWVQMMAGSLLGAFWPLLVASGRNMWGSLRGLIRSRTDLGIAAAIALAIFLNGALSPFYTSIGCMQNGLAVVAIAGFLGLGIWLAEGPTNRWKAAVFLMAAFGTLPWCVLNLGVTTGIELSESFRTTLAAGSEGDWGRIVDNRLESLGMVGFPYVQLALGAIACGVVIFASRARGAKVLAPA